MLRKATTVCGALLALATALGGPPADARIDVAATSEPSSSLRGLRSPTSPRTTTGNTAGS